MAASAKRKKEKKKDFQKPKLKVGKTKAKASNFTDTSFKAKSITLSQQSISVAAPTTSALFAHHVSSLRNRSDGQRAESLAYLTTAIQSTPPGIPLPEATASLLPKLQPLVLDGSTAVRQQLLKLFKSLPVLDINAHVDRMLLYVHAGMTHLSRDIRAFSMDVLDWLLDAVGEGLVSSAGGWTKTLDCFCGVLGFKGPEGTTNGWTSFHKQTTSKTGTESKTLAKQLLVLANLIRTGIGPPTLGKSGLNGLVPHTGFPLRSVRQNLLPERSNAFAHLDLFENARGQQAQMLEDREDRQRLFAQEHSEMILRGVAEATKEGGELGRAGAALKRAIADGLPEKPVEENSP